MGMSASQARFLSLTARKNNVEFEGQQINQQRTTLSNESASYYSELCNMAVPTPPSIDDYTKVSYTFNDGAMTNTLISLLPKSGTNNQYVVNYVEEWQDDYAIVPASSSLVEKQVDDEGNITGYTIGSTSLRMIKSNNADINNGSANQKVFTYNITTSTGVDPNSSNDDTVQTLYYTKSTAMTKDKRKENVIVDSSLVSLNDANKPIAYIDSTAPTELSKGTDNDGNTIYFYKKDVSHNIAALTEWEILNMAVDADEKTFQDIKKSNPSARIADFVPVKINVPKNSSSTQTYYIYQALGEDGNIGGPYTNGKIGTTTPQFYIEIPEGEKSYNKLIVDGSGMPKASTTESISGADDLDSFPNDEYLSSLTQEQKDALLKNEQYLLKMAQEKSGDDGNFYIRYIKNTTTGNYEPYLYAESELQQEQKYNNKNLGSIPCYSLGSTTRTREILGKDATVEKDSSGRYVAITINLGTEDEPVERTYNLITTTTTDEEAYNDAMNQYNYRQHEYDHKIQEINSKLEIVQQQDKQLELKLKQLDTEENAISTEIDAVKKVISKNVESSFKTFNA